MSIFKAYFTPLLFVLMPSLSGCNGTTGTNFGTTGANIGTALGLAAGAFGGQALGEKIGGTGGQVAGGVLGGLLGGFIGNQIGQYLDPEEKKQASIATQQALDSQTVGTPSTTTWTSPTNLGTSGGTMVTQQTQMPNGQICKTTNSFAKVKGKDISVSESYCRNPQTGAWVLQA